MTVAGSDCWYWVTSTDRMSTLQVIGCLGFVGIQHYLYENGRIDNIFTDFYYKGFTDALNAQLSGFQVCLNTQGVLWNFTKVNFLKLLVYKFKFWSGTRSIIIIIFTVAISTQKLLNDQPCSIFHIGCDHASVTGRGSAINRAVRGRLRSSTSLGCLSSLEWFVCSSSEFPMHYPSACSAVQCPSWYVDITTAFSRVPVHNFMVRVIAQQRVPIATPTNKLLCCFLTDCNKFF